MSALPVPDDLRGVARRMRQAAAGLTVVSQETLGVAEGTDVWQGLAAAAHGARVRSLAGSVAACAAPLEVVAGAVDRFAEEAELAASEERRLQGAAQALERERALLLQAQADLEDPVTAARWRASLVHVDDQLSGVGRELDATRERLVAAERVLADVVEEQAPPPVPPDLLVLARTVASVAGAVGGARRIHQGAALLALTVRHARSADLAARLLLGVRVHELLRAVEALPWWARRLGRWGALAVPLTVVPAAVADVVTGGGHDGWRGGVTRATGALAVAGSVAIVAPVPVPHVKAAGAIALGSYAVWKGGSWVYDHRDVVRRVGGVLWEEARRRAAELAEWMRPTPTLPWGPLGPLPPLLGTGAGWDGLRDLLPDLPSSWRDRLPEAGEPVPLPELPLGPVVRVPVIPGPVSLPVPVPLDPRRWWP